MALLPQKLKKGKPSGTIEAHVSPITEITIEHLKQLLGAKSYPAVLDLSSDTFQIRDDGFLLNCADILKELYLNDNSLIAVSALTHFSRLQVLVLDNNQITSMNCQGLYSLVHLSVRNNLLANILKAEDLKKITYLDLSHNNLNSNLEQLGELQTLKYFDLSANPILTLHREQRKSLPDTKLYFSMNDLDNLFDEFGKKLTKLEYFCCDEIPGVTQRRLSTSVIVHMPRLRNYNGEKIHKSDRKQKVLAKYKDQEEDEMNLDTSNIAQAPKTELLHAKKSTPTRDHSKEREEQEEQEKLSLKSKKMSELIGLTDDLDTIFDNIIDVDQKSSTIAIGIAEQGREGTTQKTKDLDDIPDSIKLEPDDNSSVISGAESDNDSAFISKSNKDANKDNERPLRASLTTSVSLPNNSVKNKKEHRNAEQTNEKSSTDVLHSNTIRYNRSSSSSTSTSSSTSSSSSSSSSSFNTTTSTQEQQKATNTQVDQQFIASPPLFAIHPPSIAHRKEEFHQPDTRKSEHELPHSSTEKSEPMNALSLEKVVDIPPPPLENENKSPFLNTSNKEAQGQSSSSTEQTSPSVPPTIAISTSATVTKPDSFLPDCTTKLSAQQESKKSTRAQTNRNDTISQPSTESSLKEQRTNSNTDEWRIPLSDVLLEKLLGEGSLGQTFLARPVTNKQTGVSGCIAKVLRVVPRDITTLESEVSLLTRITGDFFAKVVGICIEHPVCVFTEEVQGTPLYVLARERKMLLKEKNYIAAGIVSGLKTLHAAGMVHGLLKSDDVLVDYDGDLSVKLTSFGLVAVKEELVSAGVVFSPQCVAPEMCLSILDPYGPPSPHFTSMGDIYALSTILWELYEGGFPHFTPAPMELAITYHEATQKQRRNGATGRAIWVPTHPFLPEHFTHTPHEMIDLIKGGMSFLPESRPHLDEFEKALLLSQDDTAAEADKKQKAQPSSSETKDTAINTESKDGIGRKERETIMKLSNDWSGMHSGGVCNMLRRLANKPRDVLRFAEDGFIEELLQGQHITDGGSDEDVERLLDIVLVSLKVPSFCDTFGFDLDGINVCTSLLTRGSEVTAKAGKAIRRTLRACPDTVDAALAQTMARILLARSGTTNLGTDAALLSTVMHIVAVALDVDETGSFQETFFSKVNYDMVSGYLLTDDMGLKGRALSILGSAAQRQPESISTFLDYVQTVLLSAPHELHRHVFHALARLQRSDIAGVPSSNFLTLLADALSHTAVPKERRDIARALLLFCRNERSCKEALSFGVLHTCIKYIAELENATEDSVYALLYLMEQLFCCDACRRDVAVLAPATIRALKTVMRHFPTLSESILNVAATLAFDKDWLTCIVNNGVLYDVALHMLAAAHANNRGVLRVALHLLKTAVHRVTAAALAVLREARIGDTLSGMTLVEYQSRGDLLEDLCSLLLAMFHADPHSVNEDSVSTLFAALGDENVSREYKAAVLKFLIQDVKRPEVAERIAVDSFYTGIVKCFYHDVINIRVFALKAIVEMSKNHHTLLFFHPLAQAGLKEALESWKAVLAKNATPNLNNRSNEVLISVINSLLKLIQKSL